MNPILLVPLLAFALLVLENDPPAKAKQEADEWDSVSVGQTGLLLRGNKEGISYNEDSSILWGRNVIGQCPYRADYRDGSRVYVSPASPKKDLFVILCWEDQKGGKAGWVVNSRNRTVLAKNIVPARWGIASWVSWSPSEDFAVFHAVGEVTMGDMLFVNLASGRPQEIHFKDFTNNPRTDRYERVQDFDRDALVWLTRSSFRVPIEVHCNPYEGPCDYEKILSRHSASVNLSPFKINYGIWRQRSRKTYARL